MELVSPRREGGTPVTSRYEDNEEEEEKEEDDEEELETNIYSEPLSPESTRGEKVERGRGRHTARRGEGADRLAARPGAGRTAEPRFEAQPAQSGQLMRTRWKI